MSSNDTAGDTGGGNGNGNGNGNGTDPVAISALVISLVALLAAVLQLAQTIVASATGLPSCDKRVMGGWAKDTRRRFRPLQLRLEVEFEAPVIFLARSDNKKGPVIDADEIVYADGTPESCAKTKTAVPRTDLSTPAASSQGIVRERVHTVDNELASWVVLLEAVQKMEFDSRTWEGRRLREHPVTGAAEVPTLAVGVQKKLRSFDANPAIKKPYATTTICHIIELAAVLGLYWKVFDRDGDKYHAAGNGYSLMGSRVNDFGIVFTFEKPGWPRFGRTRVIPTSEVKELCFGNVPTFYRPVDQVEDEHWKNPVVVSEQLTLKTLQLGSIKEIADTLHLIGVNEYTTHYYLTKKPNAHLFPVTFEIMGMLSRTMHVRNRAFTYLPNPTVIPLNKQSFSLRRLLGAFAAQLASDVSDLERELDRLPADLEEVLALTRELESELPHGRDGGFSPPHLNLIHTTLDRLDTLLLRKAKDVVLDVLRRHLQEVLLAINTTADQASGSAAPLTPVFPRPEVSFDDLRGVPPENREREFMSKYFEEIRPRVISTDARGSHDPQAADASRAIHNEDDALHDHGHGHGQGQGQGQVQAQGTQQESNGTTHAPPARANTHDSTAAAQQPSTTTPPAEHAPSTTPIDIHAHAHPHPHATPPPPLTTRSTWGRPGPAGPVQRVVAAGTAMLRSSRTMQIQAKAYEVRRNTIWCALVFRMVCWLMLHDFDKRDRQRTLSELMGSRLPVYIM